MSTSDGPGAPIEPGTKSPRASEREAYRLLAERIAKLREDHDTLAVQVTDVASASSEILPRLDALELVAEQLGAALDTAEMVARGRADRDDLTPATRWSQLDRGGLTVAWDALGEWVAAVLNGEYRLTRGQLPDCWPVHPRAVRELAWLRTLHVASSAGAAVPPEVVGEWHSRWLPAALYNIASSIDPRECAPGLHRVTWAERQRFERELADGGSGGANVVLTTEQGADRPRYVPDQMPPRRSQPDDLGPVRGDAPGASRLLDELTPPPPSRPEHWWAYFQDARRADLAAVRDDGEDTSR